MRQFAARLACGLVLHLCACGSEDAPGIQAMRTLDVTPQVVTRSRALERVSGDEMLELRVALPLRNDAQLREHLEAMGSGGTWMPAAALTPAQFADDYHPTGEAVRDVQRVLRGYHLEVDDDAHGTLLGVRGRVADVERAFGVQLHRFVAPSGEVMTAPRSAAQLDAALDIVAVHGLVVSTGVRSFVHARPAGEHDALGMQRSSSSALSAAQVRAAYNIPTLLSGASARVGLVQLSGFDPNDISRYAKAQSQSVPPITTLLIDTNQATRGTSFQQEVTADIEMVMAALPNVSEIRLYTGPPTATEQQMLDLYNEMANPTLGDKSLFLSLSTSYGQFEDELSASDLNSKNVIFAQMAAQGQTLFSAAGDSGAYADGNHLTVIDPAIEPWVTGVGGTRLTLNNGSYSSETAWAQGGGGVSAHFAMPSYQQGLVTGGGSRSLSMRNTPDVALNADPNSPYLVVYNGTNYLFGGTSLAAPLWASIWAMAQGERNKLSMPTLGHFNTVLYSLMRDGFGPSTLNDITSGNNGYYPATQSFDDVTGWGTPNAAVLLQVIASSYPKHTISAPGWTVTP